MGPPREHGGMLNGVKLASSDALASMGPPREHGGMALLEEQVAQLKLLQWGRRVNTAEWVTPSSSAASATAWLQWGRRVNTAECFRGRLPRVQGRHASMGPPREHGGMVNNALSQAVLVKLQWGRRVNTAEWSRSRRVSFARWCFNGAAA